MTSTLNPPRNTDRAPTSDRRGWHGASVGTQILVLAGRSLRALLNDPRVIIFSVLQPLIMLTLFSQVFGNAMMASMPTAGGSYINYLMPAILVTTSIGSALQAGVGLITDMKNGVLARFRSLPIWGGSVLFARGIADIARTTVQLIFLLLAATVLFGFSPAGGVAGVVAALLLALLVTWSLTWLFLAMAVWVRKEEVMQSVGFLTMFPLMFASSAFVPLEVLPGWLRAVATVNPLTYAVDAARDLALATPVGTGVLSAVAASLLVAVVGIILALKGFRRPL